MPIADKSLICFFGELFCEKKLFHGMKSLYATNCMVNMVNNLIHYNITIDSATFSWWSVFQYNTVIKSVQQS